MENYHELGRLFVGLARLHSTRADQVMDQIGLFRGQGMLLKFLSKFDGQTLSEIAEKLEISPAAVTKVTKRMEEQNYLKRQPDPKDERVSRVLSSRKVRRKLKRYTGFFKNWITQHFRDSRTRNWSSYEVTCYGCRRICKAASLSLLRVTIGTFESMVFIDISNELENQVH